MSSPLRFARGRKERWERVVSWFLSRESHSREPRPAGGTFSTLCEAKVKISVLVCKLNIILWRDCR